MSITEEYERRLADWSDIQGHMPFLRDALAGYDHPVVVELGVRSGQSTSAFLAEIESGGGQLWSVDVNEPQVPPHWFDIRWWNFLKADDCSAEAQEWLPGEIDVLFIDTSHERQHTDDELRLYMPRVRAGGIALFHDTLLAKEGEPEGTRGHVWDALDAWCGERSLTWENRPGFYGLGMVRF